MKERKSIILKVFVPIFIICIVISGVHYYQLVENNIVNTVEKIDNTSHMLEFYSRINEERIELSSSTFEKEYQRVDRSHYPDSYGFKSVLDEDKNIQKFDIIGYHEFGFQMTIADEINSYNLNLSLLNDKQLLQVMDILKVEYKNKIVVEVAGEKKGAIRDGEYIPEAIVASYLKINDQVIVDGDDSTKVSADFNMYQDKDCIIITGYNVFDQHADGDFGVYIDIRSIRNRVTTFLGEGGINEYEWNPVKEEIDGNYYIYDYFPIYEESSIARPKYLLSLTVVPDVRKNISEVVFMDNMISYGMVLGLLFVAGIVLQYVHWKPTKKILITIHKIGGNVHDLKQIDAYIADLDNQHHQDMEQLKQEKITLEQQLRTLQPIEVLENKATNEVRVMVNSTVERYRLLLNNKMIKIDSTILINTIDNLDNYKTIFDHLLNIIIYQIKPSQTIEIIIDQNQTEILISDTDINLQNNEIFQELFKKYQYLYKVDIINDKMIISFYPQTNL